MDNKRLYINIENNVEININKISFICNKNDYDTKYKSLNIKEVFTTSKYTVLSYIIIKEFGEYYSYASIHTPETIAKRIYKVLRKNNE